MLDATIKTGAGQSSVTFYANRCSSLYKEDLNEVRVNALFGLNLIKAFYRIFSVIQILQGTTILRLLPEVLLAPVLDGHSLLCENREQLEESLTLMLQDRTRFMGRQRQINPQHSDFYA